MGNSGSRFTGCSGKPVVNSISLKEGEEEFIKQAKIKVMVQLLL
jgi:cobalamin-dependent methionine synthase I